MTLSFGVTTTLRIGGLTEEGKLAASYLVAILEGDRQKALSIICEAASAGWSITDLYLHVLAPAQREIGQMWIDDEINIADEHFSTINRGTVLLVHVFLLHRGTASLAGPRRATGALRARTRTLDRVAFRPLHATAVR